jgi:modulator of FtsH protease HflK
MADERDWLKKILVGKGWEERRPPGEPPRRPGGRDTLPQAPQGGQLLLILAAIVALWGIWSVFYTVQPEERAVVKRFGRVIGISDPGLHFKIPFGVDTVQIVATERVLKEEFGFRTAGAADQTRTRFADRGFPEESLVLTGDLNVIDVEWVVQYRIADPIKYIYSMREPTRTLRDLSESIMRRVVGNRIGSEALTVARVEISTTVRDELQAAMQSYDNGIQIITVELQNVVPPERVQPAFNEVNVARQERERMINEANKMANQAIPRAQGEANRIIAESEGYAAERVNRAFGETARFSAVLAEYRNAPDVTRTRMYLEALQRALPRVGSIVVVQNGQQMSPLPLLQLRDAQPRRQPAQAAPPPPAMAQPEPQMDPARARQQRQ